MPPFRFLEFRKLALRGQAPAVALREFPLAHFWPTFGPHLAHFWPTFGPLSAHFRPTFGPLSAHFWPTLANIWPTSVFVGVDNESKGKRKGNQDVASPGPAIVEFIWPTFGPFWPTFGPLHGFRPETIWPTFGSLLAHFGPPFGPLLAMQVLGVCMAQCIPWHCSCMVPACRCSVQAWGLLAAACAGSLPCSGWIHSAISRIAFSSKAESRISEAGNRQRIVRQEFLGTARNQRCSPVAYGCRGSVSRTRARNVRSFTVELTVTRLQLVWGGHAEVRRLRI